MARSRKNKGRKSNRKKGKKNIFVPQFHHNQQTKIGGRYNGILEINEKGYGFVRRIDFEFSYDPKDPFLKPDEVKLHDLRSGLVIEGEFEQDQSGNRHIHSIERINGKSAEEWQKINRFELQTPIMPNEYIKMGHNADDTELRVIDLIAPIGRGQRALIVAPPRTGKTVLLKKIARSLTENYPEISTGILLVDERPEEVTDFLRSTNAEVFASSNDKPTESHIRISEMALGYVKRKAEYGGHAVLLIDSLTRLGRAYNAAQANSGRTLSGGLDIRALEIPKKIFGSARKIEGGGSLTIIATCLIETNSRMDDLIFEEFKGTGNMELVLDRDIANDRIYPAINIAASGTRNEDKFITDSLEERNMVRRFLLKKNPKESLSMLLQVIRRTDSNEELFAQIAATT
ncbi:transcription termination factor Rho [Rhodohalobacter sulfatireducens]|uniref:Transcription termination factor Rho n=1 Tax=Rhodohalobacter sulfatireducens TaxID=2911366 RepID=A0ABS9K9X6_9BACT|nr:transcription termination factor Rho [Rhodohalobacter sulfatireducens]MCG2587655.1 transcription termination factor Rho [Rhodohalobacter sulfatireducens]MDR9366125.1 transcription termination factor Rho [Balneolaceae bacterium]MDR9409864.1 transcription termination factor Rho [Balneolaceae bacterium]